MALTQQNEPKFIVVIGTSAGGIRAIEELGSENSSCSLH